MIQIIGKIYPKLPNPQVAYKINAGINDNEILQLISYTNSDSTLKHQVSDLVKKDGSPGRFSNILEYKKWYQKGKNIYALLSESNILCGICWFSKELPEITDYQLSEPVDISTYRFTFGIRLYASARGIGLSIGFAEIASNHFCQSQTFRLEAGKGIWLETDITNIPATKTYAKLGYRQIGSNIKTGRLIMIKDFLL